MAAAAVLSFHGLVHIHLLTIPVLFGLIRTLQSAPCDVLCLIGYTEQRCHLNKNDLSDSRLLLWRTTALTLALL